MNNNNSLRWICVGDIAIGNHPKRPGFGFYSKYSNKINPINHKIFPNKLSADIVFGNLEFILTKNKDHPGTNSCCIGSISHIPFLKNCGFTVLNVATNHALDYGEDKFRQTIKALSDAMIKVVGIDDDFEPKNYLIANGQKIAIFGCSAHPQSEKISSNIYNTYDKERFIKEIKNAKKIADIVVVSIHWGEEFIPIPSTNEKKIARDMIDAGASLVIGHHPHVLRSIECYKHGIVAYSLGNFIGDMTWNPLTCETGALFVEFLNKKITKKYFYPALINKEFFPVFFRKKYHKKWLDSFNKRQNDTYEKLKVHKYKDLAQKALRKNQLYTIIFFIKNIFEYSTKSIIKIIKHGIMVRILKKAD